MPLPAPPLSMATLLTPVTQDQIRAKMVANLVALGIRADLWPAGGAASTVLTVVAMGIFAFSQAIVDIVSAGFLPTATAGWLTWIAFYFYGLNRTPATFATGLLTLSNSGGGSYAYDPFTATFASSVSPFPTYTNVDPIALGSGPSTQTITIQASAQGIGGNAGPGQVTTLVTSMIGVECSNAAPVLGVDAQTDASLAEDCYNRLGASSVRGPQTAYKYYSTRDKAGAPLLNAGGAPVDLNRISVSPASHTGQVTVTLAGPDGVPASQDVDAATASMILNALPQGVTLIVQAATEIDYAPPITIWAVAAPGLVADDLAAAASAALALFFETYPIGGISKGASRGLFASGIDGVIKATNAAIFAVDGAIDLPMVAGQVAVDLVATPVVRMVTT